MKWYGQIGFEVDSVMTAPGVYSQETIEVRNYFGDVLRHKKNFDSSNIVTDFNITNQLSVLSDEYLAENLHKIVYITFMGGKWKVRSAEVNWPRITLEIGDTYKGEEEDDDE